MPETPTIAPTAATAGDSLAWYQDAGDYLPSDGWALTWQVVGRSETVTATAVGGQYLVTVPTTLTAGLGRGAWRWVVRVARGAERVTLAQGVLNLAAAPEQDSATTHAGRMLAAIEAVLEGRATTDLAQYTVAGRNITKLSPAELVQWRNYYRAEVASEQGGRGAAIGVLRYQLA